MSFDKAALFAAIKPKTVPVPIDGFGTLTFRQLSVREVRSVREMAKDDTDEEGNLFGLQLVIMSAVDEDGSPIFTKDDIAQLQESGATYVEDMVGKTLELNGFAKAKEAKN